MYHHTSLDCKSFNISEGLVEVIVALTLNIQKWYFWIILWLMMMHHHTKFDWSEILFGQTFTEVQNLYCDLDQSNLFTRHSSLWTCTVKLSWSPPKNQQFRTYNTLIELVIFDCMNRNSVTLTLKIETHFLYMTLWLIMMSHHTGFGYKWFSDAEDIIQTNVKWNFQPWLWHQPWTQQSNIFTWHVFVYDDLQSNWVWLQKTHWFRTNKRYSRNCHILII